MPTTKKYSLPRDFATKWVTALRSGELPQSKGTLGNIKIGYCCLGVGGRICGATDEMLLKAGGYLYNSEAYFTPEIRNKIPKEISGSPEENELVATVSAMNDRGATFPQIADWIEENVEFV